MNRNDLHDYQEQGHDHIINNSHCGLFLEMGLGKTVTTLTAINTLIYDDLEIDRVLIIAPKRVTESVWSAEIEKWRHLRHLRISKVVGTSAQRKKALKVPADIYIIGRDNTAWLCGLYGGSMLPFQMIVLDESSSFKNPSSVRFKALRKVQPSFSRVVILTGTPAPNGLEDLWSQIYLLDRGQRLGKFITKFREEFFTPDKRRGDQVYNYRLKTDSCSTLIYDRIKDICMSMKARDYLKLPDRINNIIRVKLDQDTKKKYNIFERDQVLQLIEESGGEITAMNAAALSNKLLQFANGAVYDEHKKWHEVHRAKIEALEEILESANGNPVLLAWTFRHDMERIKKYFYKYKPVELKTDEDIQKWNKGEIKFMMMHPASGGHGLNLQEGGNIIVWFGNTYSLELEQQFNARLHRQGQKKTVIIHKLVVEGSMDEEVIEAQERKCSTQDGLMEAVKARIKKYSKLSSLSFDDEKEDLF